VVDHGKHKGSTSKGHMMPMPKGMPKGMPMKGAKKSGTGGKKKK